MGALYFVLHWCTVWAGLLKLTWLPAGRSWNRVSGLIAAAVCPKGSEPWEQSGEAWQHWEPEERSLWPMRSFSRFFSQLSALLRILASTHRVTQTKSAFSIQGLPSFVYDLKALANKYWLLLYAEYHEETLLVWIMTWYMLTL